MTEDDDPNFRWGTDLAGEGLPNGGRVLRDRDGDYVLTGGGYDYEIVRSRIDPGPKLVEWVRHLIGKSWVTKEDVEELIELVAEDSPHVIDRGA